MINDIEKLKGHSRKYVHDFITNCTIEEKIDTHYVSVEIVSPHEMRFLKNNGDEIDRVDLILNSMWSNLQIDWNYLRLLNADWFMSHIGHRIKMFYFPCDTPILTGYKPGLRYVFDKILFNDNELDTQYIISDIVFPDTYKVGYKTLLAKIDDTERLYDEFCDSVGKDGFSMSDLMSRLVDTGKSGIFALDRPEGYIFKLRKKIYQLNLDGNDRRIEQERSSYEYMLSDFIQYMRDADTDSLVMPMYTKTVCNLFNDYIVNYEQKTHKLENNVETGSLESPCLGTKFDIGYDYIPDPLTKKLCRESELYKNVFKILLANLRRGKDYKHCVFLNKKEVDEWNTMVKSIKIRTVHI